MSAAFLSIAVSGVATFLALDIACFAWLRSGPVRRPRPVRVERAIRHANRLTMTLSDHRSRR